MTTDSIIWEDPDPPESEPERFSWGRALAAVRERPREWGAVRGYRLQHSARASLSLLRNRRIRVPEGEWRFTMRKRDDGLYWIYARFES